MKNQYFRIVKCTNQDDYEVLTCVHVKRDQDVWSEICELTIPFREWLVHKILQLNRLGLDVLTCIHI